MLLKLSLQKALFLFAFNLICLIGLPQLTVKSNGDIKIGSQTTSPSGGKLEITGTATTLESRLFVVSPDISRFWTINSLYSYGFGIDALGVGQIFKNINSPSSIMTFNSSGNFGIGRTPSFKLDVNGTIRMGTQVLTSDSTYKKDIKPLDKIAASIYNLQPYQFRRKRSFYEIGMSSEEIKQNPVQISDDRIYFGFIAQDVQKVLPNLVYSDSSGILSVDYLSLIPLMLQELKSQQNELVLLQQELLTMKSHSIQAAPSHQTSFDNKLFQNYPNPAISKTDIMCLIDQDAVDAYIYIYDSQGKLVEKQIIKERGQTIIHLNTQLYVSGMYCYFLVVDDKPIDSKQLIIHNQ